MVVQRRDRRAGAEVGKEVLVRENDELLHIELGSDDVDATTSHPFYVVGRGWVAAGDLAVGDSIRALSGDVRTVTALRLEKLESPIPVYNLDVEDFDSYFVGSGVLVHNKCLNNKRANSIAQYFGYKDAEDFKEAFVGEGSVKLFNININKKTKEVILEGVRKGVKTVFTGLVYK